MSDYMKCDAATSKWFAEHPYTETTVCQCSVCGLYYKPSLGHKCKKGGKADV